MHPFQLMAEPVRRRIIEILASGEHTSGELSEVIRVEFAITRQAVSHHLCILVANNWLSVRREWTTNVYGLTPDVLGSLQYELDWLQYLWERRIGWRERDVPLRHSTRPFEPRPYPRPPVGESRRGLRGKRRDPWSPMP